MENLNKAYNEDVSQIFISLVKSAREELERLSYEEIQQYSAIAKALTASHPQSY